ncbi:MAG: hypothetical protein SynsKO_35120 [Synoicihabitans sp.]
MINPKPLVSVVIPLFNGARFIGEALQSVLNQDYPNLEILVIDDGSTDSGAEIVHRFEGVKYHRQENSGNAVARNRGVALAKGDFIAHLDQDDLWRREKISRQMALLSSRGDASIAICRAELLLEEGMTLPPAYAEGLYQNPWPAYLTGALLAKREAYAKVGAFDPEFRAGNDSDWFFRATDLGMEILISPETLFDKRVHHENQGHDLELMKRDLMRLVRASILRKRRQGEARPLV